MKRPFIIPLVGMAFASFACGLASGLVSPKTPSPQLALTAAVNPTAALLSPTLAPLPSVTSSEPSPSSGPTQPASPPAQPAAPAPQTFTETFDQTNDHWSDPLIVTSQAPGRDPLYKLSLENGRLRVALQDKETYLYSFFNDQFGSPASISITYEYRTLNESGVALVCRANAEKTDWYEARLIAGESKYDLYAYHKRQSEDDQNPYTLLAQGVLQIKEFSPVKSNVVTFTCADKELKLDLNNGARVITQSVDGAVRGSLLGIGVMSYDTVPVNIDYKTVVLQSGQ
jgi:hypothetical protein